MTPCIAAALTLLALLVLGVLVWLNVTYRRDPLTPDEVRELSTW